MVSGMGVFSRVRVYVVDGYGLELMAFYMFTCLVLKSMLSMNFGTSQRALTLDVDLLLTVHKDLVDGRGQFRSKGVRVGKKDPIQRPHSSTVPSLVEQALARADDGVEPPPLAATRLHLELLIIHPFSDSNGRIARLMTSYILMRAGYYSTLLSAVEQHFQVQRAQSLSNAVQSRLMPSSHVSCRPVPFRLMVHQSQLPYRHPA